MNDDKFQNECKTKRSMAEFAEGVVRDQMADGDGELRPRIYVITTDGSFYHFDYVGDSEEQMEKMRSSIRMIILASRLAGVFGGAAMIGEAWTSVIPAGEKRKYARCEDDPDRTEMVFYVSYESDGKRTFKTWDIERRDGKASIKQRECLDSDGFESWIDKPMMPLGDVSPALAMMAKTFLSDLRSGVKKQAS